MARDLGTVSTRLSIPGTPRPSAPLRSSTGCWRPRGAVERLLTLYTGGNEGIVLLIDSAIVSCLLSAGLRDSAETPVEASE
jgi:hypothetical protein